MGFRMRFSFIFFLSLFLLGIAFDFNGDIYQMAEKRGLMGGYAFGSMDKMIPAHLRKFMRVQHKRASYDGY